MSARPHAAPSTHFPCGHARTPKNTRPNGKTVKCRTCDRERSRRYQRDLRSNAKIGRTYAELEAENALLRRELDATVDALLRARRDKGGDACGSVEDDSAGRQASPEPDSLQETDRG